jgi:hypothetical protein
MKEKKLTLNPKPYKIHLIQFYVQNTHQNEQQKMLKLSYKQRNIIIKVDKN